MTLDEAYEAIRANTPTTINDYQAFALHVSNRSGCEACYLIESDL